MMGKSMDERKQISSRKSGFQLAQLVKSLMVV